MSGARVRGACAELRARNLFGVEGVFLVLLLKLLPRLRHLLSIVISVKVFSKSFCISQLLHKSVNKSLTATNIKDKLTNLWGS